MISDDFQIGPDGAFENVDFDRIYDMFNSGDSELRDLAIVLFNSLTDTYNVPDWEPLDLDIYEYREIAVPCRIISHKYKMLEAELLWNKVKR